MTAFERQKLMQDLLQDGKIDGHELEMLRQELYADGKIDRDEADMLVQIHKRVQRVTPAFEQFFYQALKDHLLQDGKIDAGEVTWLRRLLWDDGKIDEREKKFLHELKGECKQACPEFQALYEECCK